MWGDEIQGGSYEVCHQVLDQSKTCSSTAPLRCVKVGLTLIPHKVVLQRDMLEGGE